MILIVDYKAGNLTSVKRALDHLGIPNSITSDPAELLRAERIIFPGVGHAATAMRVLGERGLDSAFQQAFVRGTPIMGICLGAQIVLAHSEEGNTPCLNLIPGECRQFRLQDPRCKIPHMGWNAVRPIRDHFILKDLRPGDEFYFVHSFYPQPVDEQQVLAVSEYETVFPAVIGYRNLFAVQFHPEKSGRLGLNLLRNFALWEVA
jgi:glutamine amidotransferase